MGAICSHQVQAEGDLAFAPGFTLRRDWKAVSAEALQLIQESRLIAGIKLGLRQLVFLRSQGIGGSLKTKRQLLQKGLG